MTNAEKYLKDGVSAEEFANTLTEDIIYSPSAEDIITFLNKPITPTLTEDERVILKNIEKEYTHIGRGDGTSRIVLYIKSKDDFKHCWCFFNHLFQFIKERRRIFNRKIVRR